MKKHSTLASNTSSFNGCLRSTCFIVTKLIIDSVNHQDNENPRGSTVQYRKWSPTENDPETANDPQNGPQMILDRKWSPKLTANDPVKTWGMEWILWDWLQKRTDYKKGTFFSRLLKKKGKEDASSQVNLYKAKKLKVE